MFQVTNGISLYAMSDKLQDNVYFGYSQEYLSSLHSISKNALVTLNTLRTVSSIKSEEMRTVHKSLVSSLRNTLYLDLFKLVDTTEGVHSMKEFMIYLDKHDSYSRPNFWVDLYKDYMNNELVEVIRLRRNYVLEQGYCEEFGVDLENMEAFSIFCIMLTYPNFSGEAVPVFVSVKESKEFARFVNNVCNTTLSD